MRNEVLLIAEGLGFKTIIIAEFSGFTFLFLTTQVCRNVSNFWV